MRTNFLCDQPMVAVEIDSIVVLFGITIPNQTASDFAGELSASAHVYVKT